MIKRVLMIVFIIILITFAVLGCNGKDESNKRVEDKPELSEKVDDVQEQATSELAKVNEVAEVKEYEDLIEYEELMEYEEIEEYEELMALEELMDEIEEFEQLEEMLED